MRASARSLFAISAGSALWVASLLSSSGNVAAQPNAANPPHYERHFTPRPKPFRKDPYVWAYSREFAARYGMPSEWIDEELRGAMAVAFRMTLIGYPLCGLGGRAENCWAPLECQMDIYYDRRVNLPWRRPDIVRDVLMLGLSSRDFLPDINGDKGLRRYQPLDGKPGAPAVLESGGVITVGKYRTMRANVAYFDREYDDTMAVLGWIGLGVCPQASGAGRMEFDQPKSDVRNQAGDGSLEPMHVIVFPESFMRRAKRVYEQERKPDRDTSDRLIREFKGSREGKQ